MVIVKRQKTLVLAIAGVLISLLVITAFVCRRQIEEEWHLLQARSANTDTRHSALEALVRLKSKRSLDTLLALTEESDRPQDWGEPAHAILRIWGGEGVTFITAHVPDDVRRAKMLAKVLMSAAAVKGVERAARDSAASIVAISIGYVAAMGAHAVRAVLPILEEAAHSSEESIRLAAQKAMELVSSAP